MVNPGASDLLSAVRLVVLEDGQLADLVIDRSLLSFGLGAPISDGEVAVRVEGPTVLLSFGPLSVTLALAEVAKALLATHQATPTGTEADEVVPPTASARPSARPDPREQHERGPRGR